MGQKKVWLIRHGKTKGNEEKRYSGRRTDDALSEEGIREAERLRLRIAGTEGLIPERVCTSPLRRAVQTAEILFPGISCTRFEDLAEIDFGVFEGKNYQELNGNEEYQKWIDSNGKLPFPGGETRDAFSERTFRAFTELLGDPGKDESIAVVCHGGSIMAVMTKLSDGDFYEFMTENLGGFCLELETDHEGIHLITYHKPVLRDPA